VETVKKILVEEAASSPTLDQRLNQLELDFLGSAEHERTVQHPSVLEFIQSSRCQGETWGEIAKDVDAVFGLAVSETTVRRALSGRD
jgi:hypothetical protein